MLRTNVLMKLTRTLQCCCNRTCIPLCKTMCEPPTSPMNRSLLQWQMWQRHMPEPTPKPKVRCREPRPYKKFMPHYTLSDLKRQERQQEYLSCLPPAKPKKDHISTEMLTLLDRYAASQPMRFKPDPLHVESGPLAAYMNGVMQSDGFLNHIYNIDFYENHEPSYAALQRALEQQLNPFAIGDLFASLRAGVPLTPEQLQQLLDFLLALSHMSPAQLAAYMHQLIEMGLLTPDVLYHLQKLLAENPHLRNALSAAQLDMLTNALNKAAEEVAAIVAAQKLKEEMDLALAQQIKREGDLKPGVSTTSMVMKKSRRLKDLLPKPAEEKDTMEDTLDIPKRKKRDPDAISVISSVFQFGGAGDNVTKEVRDYPDYVNAIIHNTIPSSRRWPNPGQTPALQDKNQKKKQKRKA